MSDTLRAPSRRDRRDVREASASAPDGRRWTSLIFIALAQLMVALDATIVSIALPSAQSALHVTDAERQWVITAYTLAFGGLLLLGGRIGDIVGRKRALIVGLVGFAHFSAIDIVPSGSSVMAASENLGGPAEPRAPLEKPYGSLGMPRKFLSSLPLPLTS